MKIIKIIAAAAGPLIFAAAPASAQTAKVALKSAEGRDVGVVDLTQAPAPPSQSGPRCSIQHLELDVRKIISAGDDLALVVVEWKSKTVSSSGEAKVWAGTATDIVRRQPDGTWKLALDIPYGIEKAADCR